MINNNENEHYLLLNVEQIPTFESIDIRSITANKPEFPSEEFEEFMKLITK